ncbi:MAG: WcaF family extracellular polysaccharide biosynthesis acetyltransferase [Flavobacteriales bacterium]|jgi:putative colanic acid biosynthesis acetyltransferase WcaF|nr:WcaF family extracellular polysaccharide biosynthesis acetyltransferase [Flavobacteriales bacterium]
MEQTDLSKFNNSWYQPGGKIKRLLWFLVNVWVFQNRLNGWSGSKVFFLKLFGAKVGKNVVIKPNVNIKYPWLLTIGENSWIGEQVWIDNLAPTVIGANVCVSQGAMLLCGNHDYKKVAFDLIVGEITLEDGVWIGAHAVVGPNVTCYSHAVLSVKSVASSDLQAYTIYQGIPAKAVRKRVITD